MTKQKKTIHYGWIVLTMATMAVFGAIGLARFGYTTVLPAMQADLNLDNGQAGLLATLNLSGYLALSILGGALAVRYGIRAIAGLGLFLSGLAMVLTGFAQNLEMLGIWRFFTGAGSGAANVAIMGLWAAWFSARRRGLASGVAVSGSSIALILTGLIVPGMIQTYGPQIWRYCWFLYGGLTLLLSAGFYMIIRNTASEKGLPLIGEETSDQPDVTETQPVAGYRQVYLSPKIWYIGLIYAAYGFSYIIYMTFFIKSLTSDHGYSNISAGRLFMMLGWFSVVCGLLWGMISDRIGRKNTLLILFSFHAIAFFLFAWGKSPVFFMVSVILFGLTAWSIPAVMAAICGDILGKKMAPAAIGFITLFFGIGQAAGPGVAGIIADGSGSFSPAFYLSAAVALIGLICSAGLKRSIS